MSQDIQIMYHINCNHLKSTVKLYTVTGIIYSNNEKSNENNNQHVAVLPVEWPH